MPWVRSTGVPWVRSTGVPGGVAGADNLGGVTTPAPVLVVDFGAQYAQLIA
ncbi:MAG: hypothetical protein QOJ50_1553, partial [Cryptosporangiaceae bacterium]|nr:hypothetical protein [Cryptosporangiaceae bacterium]